MKENLQELKDRATQALRDYDKAVHLDKLAEQAMDTDDKPQVALEVGEIQAYSDKLGFSWNCNADGESVVRHTTKTIKTAFKTLNRTKGNELHKLMLAMGIMEILTDIAKAEGRD